MRMVMMAALTPETSRSSKAVAPMTSIATETITARGQEIVLTPLILPELRSFSKLVRPFSNGV